MGLVIGRSREADDGHCRMEALCRHPTAGSSCSTQQMAPSGADPQAPIPAPHPPGHPLGAAWEGSSAAGARHPVPACTGTLPWQLGQMSSPSPPGLHRDPSPSPPGLRWDPSLFPWDTLGSFPIPVCLGGVAVHSPVWMGGLGGSRRCWGTRWCCEEDWLCRLDPWAPKPPWSLHGLSGMAGKAGGQGRQDAGLCFPGWCQRGAGWDSPVSLSWSHRAPGREAEAVLSRLAPAARPLCLVFGALRHPRRPDLQPVGAGCLRAPWREQRGGEMAGGVAGPASRVGLV